jgi:hypothetical protein
MLNQVNLGLKAWVGNLSRMETLSLGVSSKTLWSVDDELWPDPAFLLAVDLTEPRFVILYEASKYAHLDRDSEECWVKG